MQKSLRGCENINIRIEVPETVSAPKRAASEIFQYWPAPF